MKRCRGAAGTRLARQGDIYGGSSIPLLLLALPGSSLIVRLSRDEARFPNEDDEEAGEAALPLLSGLSLRCALGGGGRLGRAALPPSSRRGGEPCARRGGPLALLHASAAGGRRHRRHSGAGSPEVLVMAEAAEAAAAAKASAEEASQGLSAAVAGVAGSGEKGGWG